MALKKSLLQKIRNGVGLTPKVRPLESSEKSYRTDAMSSNKSAARKAGIAGDKKLEPSYSEMSR